MAEETTLEVLIRMREEGEETLKAIKDQLNDIKDSLKDLQEQAKDTNSTLRDIAITSEAASIALRDMNAANTDSAKSNAEASAAQNNASNAARNSIPVVGGLVAALQGLGVIIGIVIGAFILMGPLLLQIIGYIVITTAYIVGLTIIFAAFIAGLVAGAITLGLVAGLLGGMAAAVVYLADRLFTTGKILTDPLLGLENNLNRMADAWGSKALPMATQIIAWLNSLIPLVTRAGNALLDWFGPHLGDILKIAQVAVNDVAGAFQELWNVAQPLISAMIASAPVWEQLFNLILLLANSAVIWLLTQLIRLQGWFSEVLPIILPIVQGIFGQMGSAVNGLAENVALLVAWFTWRLPAMQPIADQVFKAVGGFMHDLGVTAGNLVDWFIANWPQITTDTNNFFKAFADGWGKTGPTLKDLRALLEDCATAFDDFQHKGNGAHDTAFILGFVLGLVSTILLGVIDTIARFLQFVGLVSSAVRQWWQFMQDLVTAVQTLITWLDNLRNMGIMGFIDAVTGGLGDLLNRAGQARAAAGQGGTGSGAGGSSAGGPTLTMDSGGTVPGPMGQAQMAIVHGGEVVLSNDRQNDIVNLLSSIDQKLSVSPFSVTQYRRA